MGVNRKFIRKVLNKDGEVSDIIDTLLVCWVTDVFSAVIPVFLNTIRVHHKKILLIC